MDGNASKIAGCKLCCYLWVWQSDCKCFWALWELKLLNLWFCNHVRREPCTHYLDKKVQLYWLSNKRNRWHWSLHLLLLNVTAIETLEWKRFVEMNWNQHSISKLSIIIGWSLSLDGCLYNFVIIIWWSHAYTTNSIKMVHTHLMKLNQLCVQHVQIK